MFIKLGLTFTGKNGRPLIPTYSKPHQTDAVTLAKASVLRRCVVSVGLTAFCKSLLYCHLFYAVMCSGSSPWSLEVFK